MRYLLSGDWVFAPTIGNYQHRCERRIKQRAATPALDTRSILYGEPLLKFIVENVQLLDMTRKRKRKHRREAVVDIHRRWLMTPRDDHNGQSVRETLFAKRALVSVDLESRMYPRSGQYHLAVAGGCGVLSYRWLLVCAPTRYREVVLTVSN